MNKGRFHSPKQQGPAVNERIRAKSVRVISEKGDMLGVFNTDEAIKLAFEKGLDLVEVSPNALTPRRFPFAPRSAFVLLLSSFFADVLLATY